MGRKRTNNGMGPGVMSKNVCGIPMTKDTKRRLDKACEKYDATEGWVLGEALPSWLNWKGIR